MKPQTEIKIDMVPGVDYYSLAFDFTPSEQLTNNPSRIITMGGILGRSSLDAIDKVGNNSESPIESFDLKKWSRRNTRYSNELIEHVRQLVEKEHIVCVRYHAEEHAISQIGKHYWNAFIENQNRGETGKKILPYDYSKHGRARMKLTVTDKQSIVREELIILLDELYIFGWITEAIVNLIQMLKKINNSEVCLYVLIDRLPLERIDGVKADILGGLLEYHCGKSVILYSNPVGGPSGDRNLLCDNIAGLAHELIQNPNSAVSKSIKVRFPHLFFADRQFITPKRAKK